MTPLCGGGGDKVLPYEWMFVEVGYKHSGHYKLICLPAFPHFLNQTEIIGFDILTWIY